MTRINVVPVEELCDKHLLAEYRELPRVFSGVRRYQEKGLTPDALPIPPEYLLGAGHVLFFTNKLLWLSWRQVYLVNEGGRRGFNLKFTQNLRVTFQELDTHWWGDYEPTPAAIELNRSRIAERLATMKSSSKTTKAL